MKSDIIIRIEGLSRVFTTERGNNVHAVGCIDMKVSTKEFVCIVGPSGCGKSTILRIIAGLDQGAEGSILYRGHPILQPNRNIGMVFQEYSLFPWLSVMDNVSRGLMFAGVKKKEQNRVARKYLNMVNLAEFENAYPYELSGGMRQRVAIARALANDPDVLLMDEPFGALDAHTRILLQKELLRIWGKHRKTILFVTHSVDEAVFLADRILVMSSRPGRLKESIDVNMPRPRSRAIPEFGMLTDRILGELEN